MTFQVSGLDYDIATRKDLHPEISSELRFQGILSNRAVQLLLIFLVALAIRLFALAISDPGLYADATKRIFYAQEWLGEPFLFIPGDPWWPPLHIHLIGLALFIYPDPLLAPVLLSTLIGALTVIPLGLLVATQFRNSLVGVLAGVIYAFYPLGIRYTLVAQPEVIYVFWVCLGLWLLYLACEEGHKFRQHVYVILGALAMAGAAWTHLEPFWLVPIFGLLLWGLWRQLALYLAIAGHPILVWFLHSYLTYGISGLAIWTPAERILIDPNLPSDFGDYLKLVGYYPNHLVQTLSGILIILSLVGVLKAMQSPRHELVRRLFPLLSLLALVPVYLYFELLRNRMKPKETIFLAVLLMPYAALGLQHLVGLFKRLWEQGLVLAAILALMVTGPYLAIFVNYWEIVPTKRASPAQNDLVDWFTEHATPEQAIVFDRLPYWGEWYVAIALRRGPDTVFLDPELEYTPVPVNDLYRFLEEAHPAYLVLSKTESSRLNPLLNIRCAPSGCPERSEEPFLDSVLQKAFESDEIVVYRLSQQ